MFYRVLIISLFSAAAVVLSATGSAQVAAVQGDIQGMDRRPLRGGEIRIERIDTKGVSTTTKTDAKGHYFAGNLPVGAYKITLRANDEDQFSVGDIKLRANDPLKLDFNMRTVTLTLSSARAKKVRNFVWVSAGTGSNLAGRWVEVSQPENAVALNSNVDQYSGELVRELVRRRSTNNLRH